MLGYAGQGLPEGALSFQTVGNTIGYTGHHFDPATGMTLARHRWLEHDLGHWMMRDPEGYVDGMNLYEYVASSPISLVDPSGKALICKRGLGDKRKSSEPDQDTNAKRTLNTDDLLKLPDYERNESCLGMYHEHIFFEDGKQPPNTGYFRDGGGVREDHPDNIGHYDACIKGLDDKTMRQAVDKCIDEFVDGEWTLLTNNCQHFADCVLKEYERIRSKRPPSEPPGKGGRGVCPPPPA